MSLGWNDGSLGVVQVNHIKTYGSLRCIILKKSHYQDPLAERTRESADRVRIPTEAASGHFVRMKIRGKIPSFWQVLEVKIGHRLCFLIVHKKTTLEAIRTGLSGCTDNPTL